MPVYHLSFYGAKDRYIIILKLSRRTFKGRREAKCNAVKSNLGRLRATGDELSPYHRQRKQKSQSKAHVRACLCRTTRTSEIEVSGVNEPEYTADQIQEDAETSVYSAGTPPLRLSFPFPRCAR